MLWACSGNTVTISAMVVLTVAFNKCPSIEIYLSHNFSG